MYYHLKMGNLIVGSKEGSADSRSTNYNQLLYSGWLIFLLLVLQVASYSQANFKPLPNNSFQDGEKLKYDLRFGFIHGGEASLVLSKADLDGQELYHATLQGRTIGIWNKLFNVNDVFESYFVPETGMPKFHLANVQEGNYKRLFEVHFNHADYSVISNRKGYVKVPSNILDIISVFYYMRRMDYSNLLPGEILKYQTYFQDDIFPFEMQFKGYETIKTKFGKIKCLKFVPVVQPGRIFKNKDDMRVWFTNDANLIPIRIEFDMWVGSAVAEVKEYSGLKIPLKSNN